MYAGRPSSWQELATITIIRGIIYHDPHWVQRSGVKRQIRTWAVAGMLPSVRWPL
jgi:hypothetical protein